MRHLLQTKESRQLEIIEYFLTNPGSLSQDELCQKFNLSVLTLNKYFQEIQKEMPFITILDNNHNYSIAIDNAYGLTAVYNYYIQNNISFKIMFGLFFNPNYDMKTLAEKLDYSETSLYRAIKGINQVFKSRKLDIHIAPTTAEMTGSEKDIRAFYSNLFFEAYSMFEWPFDLIDKQTLTDFCITMSDPINLSKDFSTTYKMTIMFAVNLYRTSQGFYTHTKEIEFRENIQNIYSEYQEEMERLWITISDTPFDIRIAYDILFPLFDSRISYTYLEFSERAREDKFIEKSFFYLQKAIEEINREMNFMDVQQFYLLLNIHNNTCIQFSTPGSMPMFKLSTPQTLNVIKTWVPEFYDVVTRELSIYLQEVFQMENEYLVEHLTFIYLTYIESYVDEFFRNLKKIRVLILNDQGISIANQMKSELETMFTTQLEINTWSLTTQERLMNADYDIIITNFSIPKLENTYIIQTPVILLPEQFTILLEYIELVDQRQSNEIQLEYLRLKAEKASFNFEDQFVNPW